MFRRKDPLYRSFAAVLSIIVFAGTLVPLASQPAGVPALNTPVFDSTDFSDSFNEAQGSSSESGFESLIQQGLLVVRAAWEMQADAAIDAEVANVFQNDNFNTVAEYRDYVRKELLIQKQTALSNWELQADVAIEAERTAFLSGLTSAQRNNTIQQGDSEVATGQQSVQSAVGDSEEARRQFDRAREDYEQTYQSGVNQTMQEYNAALAQIAADRAAFESELAQAEQQFQQNFAQIEAYESTVRNAIDGAVTGLESQLQNSGVFHVETCDAENNCDTDPNTLNASGQTLQTLLTNLRTDLQNNQPLSTIAQQLQQYLAQREAQAIQNRDYWDGLIYENRALANEGTQPGHGLNFALYANTITGHVIDYLNGNTAPLIAARSSGHRVAQDFAGVDLRGNSPAHNPYPLTGLTNRTNQWWVANGAGDGALTYDAQGCGGAGFIICLDNPGAPNGHPEFFVDLAGTYRLYDANAENNRDVWAQYATNLTAENTNWLNNILPAIQNWEAQVANYQTSYNAWQVERTTLEQTNTTNFNQRVADLSQSRNQYLTQIEQEYRDGLNQFAILERQLAAGEAAQATIQQQTSSLARGGTLIQGGKTAAELIAASHLEKLQTPESISRRADQATPDFTAAQSLLPSFQNTLRGALNVAVAENLHDDAKDTARKASEDLVTFARSMTDDISVSDAEIHAALASMMDNYDFDVDPATIKLDWAQLEIETQAEFDELRESTRQSIEDRKKRQRFKSVEVLESGSVKITRDLSRGRSELREGGNNQNADDYIEILEETSFIIDGAGSAKLAQTADLFDAAFNANQALAEFEANKREYEQSVYEAKLAAQDKILEQNTLIEEMHKRAMKHTQMQVQMAQQAASLAQALISGGTIQSWVEGQMRGNVAGMIEKATGFPAGFVSGMLSGMPAAEAFQSYAEGVFLSNLDTALGLPPGVMAGLWGEHKAKSAAGKSPTAKLAGDMAQMGTVMGTVGGMALGFMTGGPMGALAGGAAAYGASKAIEPGLTDFYQRNPMAMDAAAFMATAATASPGVWASYQGIKGYHQGGALGSVAAIADTGLMALSYLTPVNASVSYTDDGGFGGSVGVGVGDLANVGVTYSDMNGFGASLAIGGGVGLGMSIATSQYGGNTVGLNYGIGFGERNQNGVLSGGLSYNSETGAGANLGYSRGIVEQGKNRLGASGNVGLNWNETNGFGGGVGVTLTHNPNMIDEFRDPAISQHIREFSGSGLNLGYNEREGLSMSAAVSGANLGSYNFDSGEFAYNENFAHDTARAIGANKYQREAAEELQAGLDAAFVDNRDKMTDAEWQAFEDGKLSPADMAEILKEINGGEGLANVATDESSFGDGLLDDFWGKFVMLGETIAGNNANKYGYIDSEGEYHLRTCFVAGTLVQLPSGPVAIERLKVGDKVYSWNEHTGAVSVNRITELFIHEVKLLFELRFEDGSIIETTWNHPFWVDGLGWTDAGNLKVGDRTVVLNDQRLMVMSVKEHRLDQPVHVYNIEVENDHTYFVGPRGVVVHNYLEEAPTIAETDFLESVQDNLAEAIESLGWESAANWLRGDGYVPNTDPAQELARIAEEVEGLGYESLDELKGDFENTLFKDYSYDETEDYLDLLDSKGIDTTEMRGFAHDSRVRLEEQRIYNERVERGRMRIRNGRDLVEVQDGSGRVIGFFDERPGLPGRESWAYDVDGNKLAVIDQDNELGDGGLLNPAETIVNAVTGGGGGMIRQGGKLIFRMIAGEAAEQILKGTLRSAIQTGMKQGVRQAMAEVSQQAGKAVAARAAQRQAGGMSSWLFKRKPKLDRVTTAGVRLKVNPDKTTTVLGNYQADMKHIIKELEYPKTHNFGSKVGGFNALNVPDGLAKDSAKFWTLYNKQFLDAAIKRGDDIVLATKPVDDVLFRIINNGTEKVITGFGREFNYLKSHGYSYDPVTSTMRRLR
jgi:hypothetical protein